jgi:hypothetical protein
MAQVTPATSRNTALLLLGYPVNSQNSIVREVSNFINDKGWELHHVTVLSGSLANVFNKIVTHNADFGMVSTSVLDSATENKA